MHALGVRGVFEGVEQEVADAAGFEGAAGLQVLEFEEDSASTV